MDGYTLLTSLHQAIGESSTSTWPNVKLSYEHLYKAAVATADKTGILTTSQTLTTVAEQENYTLNANFLRLYMKDDQNKWFVQYNNGTSESFLYFVEYDAIALNNAPSSVAAPNWFTIRDSAQVAQITGSASATGSIAYPYTIHGETCGETILTVATAILGAVTVGDIIHNTTDGSHGIVIALVNSTNVVCALFGGTLNYFTSGDAFVINPQMRYELLLDPPPSTASHTIIVWYVRKSNPVYSAYRRYDFPNEFTGLVDRASFDYRFRDRQPDFADRQYRNWEMECRSLGRDVNRAKRRRGFYVNFSKPADASFTFRR